MSRISFDISWFFLGSFGMGERKTSIFLGWCHLHFPQNLMLYFKFTLFGCRKFIDKLPDKGIKIQTMIDRLDHFLALRKEVDSTADMFEKMAIDAEISNETRLLHTEDDETCELMHVINKPMEKKTVVDERNAFLNSYQRVMKQAITSDKKNHPKKFLPNR